MDENTQDNVTTDEVTETKEGQEENTEVTE